MSISDVEQLELLGALSSGGFLKGEISYIRIGEHRHGHSSALYGGYL